jgi:phosphatidylserine decarboxylase
MKEQIFFVRQVFSGAADVGALLPCSRFSARAMVSELERRKGPANILEVGSGTGAITTEIVKVMEPGDRLTVCDLNSAFMAYLNERFESEPDFIEVRDRTSFRTMSVIDLDEPEPFDIIISTLPFTRFAPQLTKAILNKYQAMLAPNGVVSYIEYAWLRELKHRLSAESDSVNHIVEPLLARHEFRRDTILRNIPPAWVHHLRFDNPPAEKASQLYPLRYVNRVQLGAFSFDTDAVRYIFGAAFFAWLWSKFAPRALKSLALVPPFVGALATVFLRDPYRYVLDPAEDKYAVLAACDGRVLAVEKVHDEQIESITGIRDWVRICTFLDISDVHMNRAPIAGRVIAIEKRGDGYAMAYKPEAENNLARLTFIEGAHGHFCVVAQRVGAVARRIVNRARVGTLIARGDKFGLIRFGSRTDVYLPMNAVEVTVGVDDYVIGGESVIARFI